MKRKFMTILAILMIMGFILSACAPAATQAPAEPEVPQEEPTEPAEVVEPEEPEPTEAEEAEEPVETEEPMETEEPVAEVEQVLTAAFTTGPGGGEPEFGRPWTGGAGQTTHVKLYITPFIFNSDLTEIIPYAVESWEHNDDFTVWTYKLREDLLWSDGEPLTAQDWKFTADFITDPEYTTDQLTHTVHWHSRRHWGMRSISTVRPMN
jgi:oligopeptide transport system substrate-binding protein